MHERRKKAARERSFNRSQSRKPKPEVFENLYDDGLEWMKTIWKSEAPTSDEMTPAPRINNVSWLLASKWGSREVSQSLYEDAIKRWESKEWSQSKTWRATSVTKRVSPKRKRQEAKLMLSKMAKQLDAACTQCKVDSEKELGLTEIKLILQSLGYLDEMVNPSHLILIDQILEILKRAPITVRNLLVLFLGIHKLTSEDILIDEDQFRAFD